MGKHKISRTIISLAITLSLCLSCLPLTRSIVADSGTVRYIYRDSSAQGAVYTFRDNADAGETEPNLSYQGVFVDGGTYEATGDESLIITNNAEVTNAGMSLDPYYLLGNSSVSVPLENPYNPKAYVVVSADNEFAYTGDKTDANELMDYVELCKPSSTDPMAIPLRDSYYFDLIVVGNLMRGSSTTGFRTIDIQEGASLYLTENCYELSAQNLIINGNLRVVGPEVKDLDKYDPKGNLIFIDDNGSLSIGENASFDISDYTQLYTGRNINTDDAPGFESESRYYWLNGAWQEDLPSAFFHFDDGRMKVSYSPDLSRAFKDVDDQYEPLCSRQLDTYSSLYVRVKITDPDYQFDPDKVEVVWDLYGDDQPEETTHPVITTTDNYIQFELQKPSGNYGWGNMVDIFIGDNNQNNHSPDGLQFFFDANRVDLFYTIGGDEIPADPEEYISPEDLANINSISVRAIPKDGLMPDAIGAEVFTYEDENDHEGTRFEPLCSIVNGALTFTVTKGDGWAYRTDICVNTPPGYQEEGMQFFFNGGDVSVEYMPYYDMIGPSSDQWTGINSDDTIPLNGYTGYDYVRIKLSYEDNVIIDSISYDCFIEDQESPACTITKNLDVGANCTYCDIVPDVMIGWGKKIDVRIETHRGEQPPAPDGMEVHFADDQVCVSYAMPEGGNVINMDQYNRVISLDDLNNSNATSVKFIFNPNQGYKVFGVDIDVDYDDGQGPVELAKYDTPYFESNDSIVITKPDGGWGKKYDIQVISDDENGQNQGTFGLEFFKSGAGEVSVSNNGNVLTDAYYHQNSTEYTIGIEDVDNITLFFEPFTEEGYVVKSVRINDMAVDLTENTYSLAGWTVPEDRHIKVEVEFAVSTEFLLWDVADHGYAYTVTSSLSNINETTTELKDFLAEEILIWYFGDEAKYPGIYADKNVLKDHLTLKTDSMYTDPCGYPYAVFTLDYDNEEVDINVYAMDQNGFMVKTPKKDAPNESEITFVATPYVNEGDPCGDVKLMFDHDVGWPQIFGNGVECVGPLISDSEDVFSGHINQFHAQEHSDTFNGINVRLIIAEIPDDDQVTAVTVTGSEDAPGWQFDKLDTFTSNADRDQATHAYVYIGSMYVLIRDVQYANSAQGATITNVELDPESGFADDCILITHPNDAFRVAFLTSYDLIPLKLTFSDNTVKYLYLHRVAARIGANRIDVEEGTGDWYFGVNHSTDTNNTLYHLSDDEANEYGLVPYEENRAICCSYLYPTGFTAPGESDMVNLFVTITKVDGSTETKLITESIENRAPYPVYPIEDHDGDGVLECLTDNPYCSDYLLWAGNAEDYSKIAKVEVIVFKPGNDTEFGGLMVGSGHGVVWTRDS